MFLRCLTLFLASLTVSSAAAQVNPEDFEVVEVTITCENVSDFKARVETQLADNRFTVDIERLQTKRSAQDSGYSIDDATMLYTLKIQRVQLEISHTQIELIESGCELEAIETPDTPQEESSQETNHLMAVMYGSHFLY